MRFVVDAQLPPALARWIAAHGYIAEHVSDLAMSAESDREIWRYALAVDAVIVTKDQDFANRRATDVVGPSIVWLRCGNTRRRQLLVWFEQRFSLILSDSEHGESIIEIA